MFFASTTAMFWLPEPWISNYYNDWGHIEVQVVFGFSSLILCSKRQSLHLILQNGNSKKSGQVLPKSQKTNGFWEVISCFMGTTFI